MPTRIFPILFSCSLAAFLHAQVPLDGAQEKVADQQKAPNAVAFGNLPEEKRTQFFKHRTEAYRLFQDKRIVEAHEELTLASKIFDQDPEVINLLGSCWVEFRDFDKARTLFADAIKLAPGVPSITFNMGEMEFVTRNWQRCIDVFQGYLAQAGEKEPIMTRIAEFKVLLCYQALGKDDEAEKLANKYDPLKENTPFYYLAQAALCYKKGDTIKAEEWNATAMRVFNNPNAMAPWQDTLIEYGYIKSFYGGEQAELEQK